MTKKNNQIHNIAVEQIWSHPDNPRKDLGELQELSNSIKENGLFQALTIVKGHYNDAHEWQDDDYTVVIGHRRLAAAKMAGLEDVPCMIAEMSAEEQLRTMLMENMQRADLTPYEQAQGFQMIMDLGGSIKQLAKDTGFSETTIKNRLEWAKLDAKEFGNAIKRQINLTDLNKLANIKDLALRNRALESIGTYRFEIEYRDCLNLDKFPKIKEQWFKVLNTFATEMPEEDRKDTYKKYTYCEGLNVWNPYTLTKPEDADTKKYFWFEKNNGHLELYCEKSAALEKSEEEQVREERENKQRIKEDEIKALAKKHYEMRMDFVKRLDPDKEDTNHIWTFVLEKMILDLSIIHSSPFYENLAQVFDINDVEKVESSADLPLEKIIKKGLKTPEMSVFKIIYASLDSPSKSYISKDYIWDCQPEQRGYYFSRSEGKYGSHVQLDIIYGILQKLGYELSDEEQQLKDGTHSLYDVLPEKV